MVAQAVAKGIGMVPRIAGAIKAMAPVGRFIANRPLQVSSGVGAVRGFADQGLGGVVPGALSGLQTGALLKMVPQGAVTGATKRLAGMGVPAEIAGILPAVGLPIAGQVGNFMLAGQATPSGQINRAALGGGGAIGGGLMQSGAGIIGYNSVTGEPIVGPAVPPGMGGYGGTPPIGGNPLDVVTPGGAASAQRLMTLKNAQTMASALNAYMPTARKFSEQAKKDEFERQMAAAGIRQNIATNATMLQNAQLAGLNMGQTGAQQVGAALTGAYNYS